MGFKLAPKGEAGLRWVTVMEKDFVGWRSSLKRRVRTKALVYICIINDLTSVTIVWGRGGVIKLEARDVSWKHVVGKKPKAK